MRVSWSIHRCQLKYLRFLRVCDYLRASIAANFITFASYEYASILEHPYRCQLNYVWFLGACDDLRASIAANSFQWRAAHSHAGLLLKAPGLYLRKISLRGVQKPKRLRRKTPNEAYLEVVEKGAGASMRAAFQPFAVCGLCAAGWWWW